MGKSHCGMRICHPSKNADHKLPTTYGPTMRDATMAPSSDSLLAPGVARYCDSGLRDHAQPPDHFSDAERESVRYGSRQPVVVNGRTHISMGAPAGYQHSGATVLTPAVRHFIRREDLQMLNASDALH